MGEKIHGLISTNWQVQNRLGDVKNSIESGVAKKPTHICMTYGHELREGILEEMGVLGGEGQKGKIGQL